MVMRLRSRARGQVFPRSPDSDVYLEGCSAYREENYPGPPKLEENCNMSERRPSPTDERSATARLRAFKEGLGSEPHWLDSEAVDISGSLVYSEETITHPENQPLLCLSNLDPEDG